GGGGGDGGHEGVECRPRLRGDARLHALPTAPPEGKRGPKPKWGKRLPPPRCGGRWPGDWQEGKAWLYGRWRQVRWKEVVCLWRVAGPQGKVKAVGGGGGGDKKRYTLGSSAGDLTGLAVRGNVCGRFRPGDGVRGL